MQVKTIKSAEDLEKTTPFNVDKLLWGTKSSPKTYGYLGFIPKDGFYLKMICEEKNPYRVYTEANDPVYQDSAMEAFFLFKSQNSKTDAIYLNFEVNANGAMLAASGKKRNNRIFLSKELRSEITCCTNILEDRWIVEIHLPVSVLNKVYGNLILEKGSKFYCNFYKIAERKEIEHYVSFSPIMSETVNFHLPEFFAEAMIV